MKKLSKTTTMTYQYDSQVELEKHSWDMLCNKWDIEQYDEENMIIYYRKVF